MTFLGGSTSRTFRSNCSSPPDIELEDASSGTLSSIGIVWPSGFFACFATGLFDGGSRNVESFEVVWCVEAERYIVIVEASTASETYTRVQ